MLKARMQLEMLKDETRQQKAILDTVDSRNLQPQGPSQKSRFDQPFHPSQMAQPGVVIPPPIFVPSQPPPDPWSTRPSSHLRSMSPPGVYDSSRLRSRSPRSRSPTRHPGTESMMLSRAYNEHRDRQPARRSDYDPGFPTTVSPPRRFSPPMRRESPPPRTFRTFLDEPAKQLPPQAPSITQKWTEQMSGISNKRNDYNDAFERLAAQEAQAEAAKLQHAANNQPPQVIDLSDSDEEPEDKRPRNSAPAVPSRSSMIPSPPRLSDYPRTQPENIWNTSHRF